MTHRHRDRVAALDLASKIRLLTGSGFWTTHDEPRADLATMVLSDGPAGVRGQSWDERDPSVSIPNTTGVASTWDEASAELAGRVLGAEARRKGVHLLLAPTIGLQRSPLGGRNFEAWSEDPYVTGRLAAAFVRGVQSQGVGATAKHFVLNDTETERTTYDVHVAPEVLRELYLRPFEDLVEAGVWAVMASYNRTDGVYLTEHRALIAELLKGQWEFDGVVVSDWFATRSVVAAARSGLDLAMPGPHSPWTEGLQAAVANGEVPEAEIDDKVVRLLRLAERTGALQSAVTPPVEGDAPGESARRQLAARGMTLLRNNGVLPLRQDDRLAVIGEFATALSPQGGGSAHVEPFHVVQPLDALADRFPQTILHEPGPKVARITQDIPVDLIRDPNDGQPGVRLEILDASGMPLLTEHRTVTGFVFAGTLPPAAHSARIRAVLTPDHSGEHELTVFGSGHVTVRLDGAVVHDVQLPLMDSDPIEALVRPAAGTTAPWFEAGRPVELEVTYDMVSGESATLARFGLGYRRPCASDEEMIRRAAAAAAAVDVAVVVIGTTDDIEAEGFDRADLRLPGQQDALVTAVARANPRTVVVMNTGSVYELPWIDEVAAVLWAGFPGQEGGGALADVLTGQEEPWGRLTITMPRQAADAPVYATAPTDGVLRYDEGHGLGYAGYLEAGTEPLFPFGFGLGYTTWSIERAAQRGNVVDVDVRNTGERAGRHVIQVYLEPAPWRTRLVGFASVAASPGESKTVPVNIDTKAASRWDPELERWVPLLNGSLRIASHVLDPNAIVLPFGEGTGHA